MMIETELGLMEQGLGVLHGAAQPAKVYQRFLWVVFGQAQTKRFPAQGEGFLLQKNQVELMPEKPGQLSLWMKTTASGNVRRPASR